jgi:hypothetical protein
MPLESVRPAISPPPFTTPRSADEPNSSQETLIPPRGGLTGVYWPLVLFALTPLALAGAVLLLWRLAKMLF